MSDTPRTDAVAEQCVGEGSPMSYVRAIDLCRQLERELNSLKPKGEKWHRPTLEAVLKGLRSEDDSTQLRAIIAQVEDYLWRP